MRCTTAGCLVRRRISGNFSHGVRYVASLRSVAALAISSFFGAAAHGKVRMPAIALSALVPPAHHSGSLLRFRSGQRYDQRRHGNDRKPGDRRVGNERLLAHPKRRPAVVFDATRGGDVLSLSTTTTTLGSSYMQIDSINSYMPPLNYTGTATWTFSMWMKTAFSGGTLFSKGRSTLAGAPTYTNPGDSIYYLPTAAAAPAIGSVPFATATAICRAASPSITRSGTSLPSSIAEAATSLPFTPTAC